MSYAEDSDSEDFSDSEYYGRRRDFDGNKFRNGDNRESQSGYLSQV